MADYLRVSYDILNKIIREKTYSTEALYKTLDGVENAELINRLVLGVLDKYVQLDYILKQLVEKTPKPAIALVLKQGLYCLKYMDSLPDYAVINNSVELTKSIGKFQLAGFVNATLKEAAKGNYNELPSDEDGLEFLSVKYSKPLWLVEKLVSDFGRDIAVNIISAEPYTLTHIRANTLLFSREELEKVLDDQHCEYYSTEVGGFLCKLTPTLKKLFKDGKITYQSITSMYAVRALNVIEGQKVLDICSAPGGKAVLIAENDKTGNVTACDVYPHRVELINAYTRRMGAKNVFSKCMDATAFEPSFVGLFDRILADVPCSALGITRKQPDILINRRLEDIPSLAELQFKIADTAYLYLKKGGIMVYSTCTLTKEENADNVNKLLAAHKDLRLVPLDFSADNAGYKQFLPLGAIDGFFIAKMEKV